MSEAPRIDPSTLDPKLIESFIQKGIPHCGALGLKVVSVGRDVTMALPWRADLVGDPLSGVLHGGAVTSLIDSVCGMAVFAALQRLKPIATLDLRIDYLKPATAQKEQTGSASCRERVGQYV